MVPRITAEIEGMAGGAASEFSRGGMQTKIEAAKIATSGGAHMVIADGREQESGGAHRAGRPCTWFLTPSTPVTSRKKWIAGSLVRAACCISTTARPAPWSAARACCRRG